MAIPIYTIEELNDFYGELPLELQDYIVSVETANKVEEIAKEHGLREDEHRVLGTETGLALMGLTTPDESVRNLVERLKISEEQAEAIVDDIDENIIAEGYEIYEKAVRAAPPRANPEELTKESVLAGIENPSPMVKTPSFMDNRLNGMSGMPKEEIVVSDKKLPAPSSPIEPAFVPPTPPSAPKPEYKGPDPYREGF